MPMLSRLLGARVQDSAKREAVLVDLVLDIDKGDYPPVTSIIVHLSDTAERVLARADVTHVADDGRSLDVSSFEGGTSANEAALSRSVLAGRDVLDSLVLDLVGRRAARANDLLFKLDAGRLSLVAADTSLKAILRRLHLGRFERLSEHLEDWKDVEFLRGDPNAVHAGAAYHRRVARLPAGDLSRLCDLLPYLHAAELVTLLPAQLGADVLELMSAGRRLQVFEELDDAGAERAVCLMAPDLAVDLLRLLEPERAGRVLERLPSGAARSRLLHLLEYPDDTAGGIMTNDVLTVPIDVSVGEAVARLQPCLAEPDFIYYVYAVEEPGRRLAGVVTLRQLLRARAEDRIEALANRYVITLSPSEPAHAAGFRVIESALAALPVVGDDGKLLGAVTVDAAIAVVAPRAWVAQAPRVFS